MERPTIRQLSYALALAETRHFGRAAESQFVSQPGLSSQIQELERRLGVTLFERTSKKVELTTAGEEFVQRAQRILADVDDLVAATNVDPNLLRGPLRVAAIPTMAPYLLPSLVRTAIELWPDVELSLHEMQTNTMVRAIANGEIDIGLLAMPVDVGKLSVRDIGDEQFALITPDNHDLAGSDPIAVESVESQPLVLLEEGHCLRDHAIAACKFADESQRNIVETASMSTLTQMVAGGLGVTFLPASAVDVEAREGTGVSVRPFDEPVPSRMVSLIWRPTDPRGPLLEKLSTEFETAVTPLLTLR